MKGNILVLHGPNLQNLGKREPTIYGGETLADINKEITDFLQANEFACEIRQSNFEGDFITWIGELLVEDKFDGLLFNPGAFGFYSYGIRDTISALKKPCVEVHMSNMHAREEFRQNLVLAPVCAGVITGFGIDSYLLGARALMNLLKGE